MKEQTIKIDGVEMTLEDVEYSLEQAKRLREEAFTEWGRCATELENVKKKAVFFQDRVEALAGARCVLRAEKERSGQ